MNNCLMSILLVIYAMLFIIINGEEEFACDSDKNGCWVKTTRCTSGSGENACKEKLGIHNSWFNTRRWGACEYDRVADQEVCLIGNQKKYICQCIREN